MNIAAQQGPSSTEIDADFELDVSFAAKGAAIAPLMSSTSDGCGQTKGSACVTCITD